MGLWSTSSKPIREQRACIISANGCRMLTGTYTGASAAMSIAAGLGANVLVGGSNRTLALQPLSVQGQVGLDIAAGIGSLDLHPSW
jgi:hypothetical protein